MAFACNLCHGPMSVTQPLTASLCGHMYHGNCLSSYFQEKNLESRPRCPCCQHELDAENGLIQLHPIPYKPESPPLDREEQEQESASPTTSSGCTSSTARNYEQGSSRSVAPQANLADVQRAMHEAKTKMDEHIQASGGGSSSNLYNSMSDSSASGAEDQPLMKVGDDLVFMMDGRVVSIDQVLSTSSYKEKIVAPEMKAVGNDGRDRTSVVQAVVLPERSLEPQSTQNFMQAPRAHENKHTTMVEHSLRRDLLYDLLPGQTPVSSLPPAPNASGSMWGAPSWQMGAPWRVPTSGGAPGNNVHRIDSLQYYPSPFIREPVKQQPPYPIQIPLHRPTGQMPGHGHGQFGSSSSSFQRYERSNFMKRKANPSEQQHGGSRFNLDTILMNINEAARNEAAAARNGQPRDSAFPIPRNGPFDPTPSNYGSDEADNNNESVTDRGIERDQDSEHEDGHRDVNTPQSQQYQREPRNSPNLR